MHLSALLFGVIYLAVAQQPAALPDTVTLKGCQINLNDQVDIPSQEGCVIRELLVKEGDIVLLDAFGGGLTWGASLLRW